MADQSRLAQYSSATPDGSPPSSPRETTPEAAQKSSREEQVAAARRNEIALLMQMRHENIIGYTKALDGTVTLERLDTTLDQKVKEPVQMTLFQKLVVMKHVAQALAYLHGMSRPILHLNVQPSSIQLGSKAGIIAKICQFGVACYADELAPLGGDATISTSSNSVSTSDSASHASSRTPSALPSSNSSVPTIQNSNSIFFGEQAQAMQHSQTARDAVGSATDATSTARYGAQTHSQPDPSSPRGGPTPGNQPDGRSFMDSTSSASSSFKTIPTEAMNTTGPRAIPAIFASNGDTTPTNSPGTSPAVVSFMPTVLGSPGGTSALRLLPMPLKPPTAQILASMRGAPLYNPPEAFCGLPYSTMSDVYSFGLTMTELLVGASPFASVRSLAALVNAIQSPPIFPDDLPPVVSDLLARCRALEPTKRPTFDEIVATIDAWFVPIFVHENLPWARKFWLQHFPGCISVRWSDFVSAMIRTLHLPTSPNEVTFRGVQKSKPDEAGWATRRLHCLKQLLFPGLTEDTDFMRTINLWIDIDKFGHIMGTFSDENTTLENFLDGVANLIETKWFHGDATGSSGPHRLSPDTFLIRLSAPAQNSLKPPNCWYTFSLKTATGNFVRETRIQRIPGRSECVLANSAKEAFPSLWALAESKGKPYGLAPVPSFLQNTLHPISAEYTTDDEEGEDI